jgi:hypothetical protein
MSSTTKPGELRSFYSGTDRNGIGHILKLNSSQLAGGVPAIFCLILIFAIEMRSTP